MYSAFVWDDFIQSLVKANSDFWIWINKNFGVWASHHLFNVVAILALAWATRKYGTQVAFRFLHSTIRADLYPTEADRKKRLKTLEGLVTTVFSFGTWIVAFLLIISELKPSYAGTLFASAGIIGVALGFGTQSLIKDFVTGIFIIAENQYRIGDIVTLGDVSGTVEAISMRTTILRDADGSVHHVPNGTISTTTNKTMDYGRINESIVVSGNADIEAFGELVDEIGKKIASNPAFASKLRESPRFDKVLGLDSKGDLIVRITAKTEPAQQQKVRSELYKELKKTATKHKFIIHT